MIALRRKQAALVALIIYPFIVLIIFRLAPFPGKGIFEFAGWAGEELAERPFHFTYSPNFWKALPIVSALYALLCAAYVSSMRNTRPGEEHGSARWASFNEVNNEFKTDKKDVPVDMDIDDTYMIFSKNIRISILCNCANINTLIVGGSGSRKTRGHIIPNLLQANSNIIVTDPKGEILAKTGKFLKMKGYDIRVLDLKNHSKSWGYNPFVYFKSENDVKEFVDNMWEALSEKGAMKGEDVWPQLAKNMLNSIMFYLYNYAPPEEQNFDTVLKIVSIIDSSEGTEQQNIPKKHEKLFNMISKESTAYSYYKMWSGAKGNTLSSIVATLTAKLGVFSLASMRKLTFHDEMNILDLAHKKVAIFMLLPDNNKSYNFLASTLYAQIITELFNYADNVLHGPLPQHVRFYMDEFANVSIPDSFDNILSTCRSRNISFCIVLQDNSQIEALFKDTHRTIKSNCAFKLFLGSNDLETCKFYAEMLGEETIDILTHNVTHGMHGSTTTNEQKQARKLMDPGEIVHKLGKHNCILIADTCYPCKDEKMDMSSHKNYKYTADGLNFKANLFDWGGNDSSSATIQRITGKYKGKFKDSASKTNEWTILSPEDIDEMIAA
ncbi:MAG: type IV secretory system conjugative DNA transfer family protein [Eubacterium sp.]|nr:type IV secretory system conjugative DNA transfer family protein [Eubacterium sp.]